MYTVKIREDQKRFGERNNRPAEGESGVETAESKLAELQKKHKDLQTLVTNLSQHANESLSSSKEMEGRYSNMREELSQANSDST